LHVYRQRVLNDRRLALCDARDRNALFHPRVLRSGKLPPGNRRSGQTWTSAVKWRVITALIADRVGRAARPDDAKSLPRDRINSLSAVNMRTLGTWHSTAQNQQNVILSPPRSCSEELLVIIIATPSRTQISLNHFFHRLWRYT